MSFADSSTISIPLSDPVRKYGKTFRVGNIYLTSSAKEGTYYLVPTGSNEPSVFEQESETTGLNISWDLIDPRNDFYYSTPAQLKNNPYISGFTLNVYNNTGLATGIGVTQQREKIFTYSNISENSIIYNITGYSRNLSIDIIFTDFTGNQSSGVLVSRNPSPTPEFTSTGTGSGIFYCEYRGNAGDFEGVN